MIVTPARITRLSNAYKVLMGENTKKRDCLEGKGIDKRITFS